MKLNQLRDLEGAVKNRKRVARGIGSGSGKTGGRGVKGQKARSGVAINGFEGGQMPIYRRLPKRGFSNIFAKDFSIISLRKVQDAFELGKIQEGVVLTAEILRDAGLISHVRDGVRLLSDGELKGKFTFEVAGASKAAISKVEKAGGTVKILEQEKVSA